MTQAVTMPISQRMVFVQGENSTLLFGDPEHDHPRFRLDAGKPSPLGGNVIHGIALPVLLGEGWIIRQIIAAGERSAFVLLERQKV